VVVLKAEVLWGGHAAVVALMIDKHSVSRTPVILVTEAIQDTYTKTSWNGWLQKRLAERIPASEWTKHREYAACQAKSPGQTNDHNGTTPKTVFRSPANCRPRFRATATGASIRCSGRPGCGV
jgi:hypothetical protein